MRTKLVKYILSLSLRAVITFVLSILLLQLAISQSHNMTSMMSVINNHGYITFLFKASAVSVFFFVYPFLLKSSKNEYTLDQYNRLLWFRWVVIVAFLVFQLLSMWG